MLDYGYKHFKEDHEDKMQYWKGFLDASEALAYAEYPEEYNAYALKRVDDLIDRVIKTS